MAAFAKLWTTDPADSMERWVGDGSSEGWKAVTVPAAFQRRVDLHGDRVILAWKQHNEQKAWNEWTYNKYSSVVRQTASALIAEGLPQFGRVSVLGFNSPEAFAAALGTIFAGGISAGVYGTNSVDGLKYILQHSASEVLFVDSNEQLQKGLACRKDCPLLKRIIVWGNDSPATPQHGGFVVGWDIFLGRAAEAPSGELERRIAAQRPGNCCYLSYTSGTTGNPKAVMISHDSSLFGFRAWWTHGGGWALGGEDMGLSERNVSYLPYSHIAGSVDIFGPCALPDTHHSTIYFAFPDALQGSLEETLRDVKPTYFAAVPRIWQKLEQTVREAIKTGAKGRDAAASIGLQETRWAMSGSAPIDATTLRLFHDCGFDVDEIYGMTENHAALLTHSRTGKGRVGSVGIPMVPHGAKVDPASGEILIRNRAQMMGYMNDDRTAEAFDAEGWFHSGDLGSVDEQGLFAITGRIKELIITAGGENMAPVPIEAALKEILPCVNNAMVVGDGQKMLICLFTPKLAPGEGGGFTDELVAESLEVDPNAKTASAAVDSATWRATIDAGVKLYNDKHAPSRAQRIRKWAMLPTDFVPPSNTVPADEAELTPTMKLRRSVVHQKYAGIIKTTYGDAFMPAIWANAAKL